MELRFLTETAYIVDFESRTEFMLTASIYVNSDQVLNDDKYDYESIGYPFFAEIGKIIYAHEKARRKTSYLICEILFSITGTDK